MKLAYTMLLTLTLMFMTGCETVDAVNPFGSDAGEGVDKFVFDSGGAKDIEGFGAWRVSFDRGGKLAISHKLGEDKKIFDPVSLDITQATPLWAAIDRLPFDDFAQADAPAQPGEPTYYFCWTVNGVDAKASMPSTQALEMPSVDAFVTALEPVLEQVTGQDVALR